MWRLADRQLDEFLDEGRCEFISAYSQPFAMLAVADLLGVPESEHQRFREGFGLSAAPGEVGAARRATRAQPARVARRLFRDVHRGPAARAAQGRPDRPRPGDVSRRIHARRHRRRTDRDLPLRRRSGDDRSPPRHRDAIPLRVPGAPGRAARAPRAHPGLHRGDTSDREPGQGRLPSRPTSGEPPSRQGAGVWLFSRTARQTPTHSIERRGSSPPDREPVHLRSGSPRVSGFPLPPATSPVGRSAATSSSTRRPTLPGRSTPPSRPRFAYSPAEVAPGPLPQPPRVHSCGGRPLGESVTPFGPAALASGPFPKDSSGAHRRAPRASGP